jgi:hypothetical protein
VSATDYECPAPRTVHITRHAGNVGYGFVAGSERPVIVRFVTEGACACTNVWYMRAGGPSANKLLAGDELVAVNGENVYNSSKDRVVELIRYSVRTIRVHSVCGDAETAATRSI